ncbi:hypothetical protein MKW98_013679 [Papaver atlanticum]|uniref:Fungal lipase-type domain-containing protein n=1 Tax=Papaver atlanticum TaxID=357466 RepID=A0AAD4XEL6_9MAGN|nr:hypothetical protein MKW98_016523 [Papaver atlanticum]KAI3906965.1 hypothetical protein MKW98_013679 [Papaver atlanticum]
MLNQDTKIYDMKLNKAIMKNKLHRTSCIEKAMQTVEFMVSISEASKIWLAGHSAGSAVAMLAGKNMAKRGNLLGSYLFNPPFVAAPTKRRHLVATCLITAALTLLIRNNQDMQHLDILFSDLSMWVPNLYLHPSDPICSGYIRYFKIREKMERHGVGRLERLAPPYSLKGLLMKAFGKDYCLEELHLIPSACVTTSCSSFLQAHGLDQWFGDDTVSDPVVHCYN